MKYRGLLLIFFLSISPLSYSDESAFLGFTRSFSEVHLSCQVSEYVSQVFFKEGDFVKKNNIVIQLNDSEIKIEAERKKLIWKSYANLNAARIKEKILAKQVKSAFRLFSVTGSISRQEYQQKQLEYELASGERKILEESKRREEIEYKAAIQRIKKHVIRSPIDGVITDLSLDKGELCDNTKIATISDPKKGMFIINVEGFLGENIKKGQKMIIALGEDRVNVQGTVIYVAPILDAASGLKKIKLVFDNSKLNILPGVSGVLKLK